MLTYEPAKLEHYEEFLQLMRDQAADYLECTLEIMEMTREQFSQIFRTVGRVYGIYEGSQLVGFYWIEERGQELHLHGLVLKEQFQGRGSGTQILRKLEAEYRDSMEVIELGVHESNERARTLYERLGYETVRVLDDLGFRVMQKRLSNEPSSNQGGNRILTNEVGDGTRAQVGV